VRTKWTTGRGHARFREGIRDVFLVTSDLSVGVVEEMTIVLLRRTGTSIHKATTPLSETILRHIWIDGSAAWASHVWCLKEGVCTGSGVMSGEPGTEPPPVRGLFI